MKLFIALIAVGLDAARIAFSKSKIEKKAVSASAAAVVGVGLLCLPIESVQGQVLSPSHVSGVSVETVDLGGDGDDISKISIDFDVFDTSSDYDVFVHWPHGRYTVINDFPDSAYHTASRRY